LLQTLRKTSQSYGRTLLGMLLLVWLSMAISPCVMAFNYELNNSANEISQHADMADCAFCPDNGNTPISTDLCQQTHNNFSHSLTLSIDVIDSSSFVLFELPSASSVIVSSAYRSFPINNQSDITTIPPLSLTGILRI